MVLYLINKIYLLREYYFYKAGRRFCTKKINLFRNHLPADASILDVGSGSGLITTLLRESGYKVTPLDIADGSFHAALKPVLYNGETMPFKDKVFHWAIILTVLHHTEYPEKILKEAARVSSNLILMEDIYSNKLEKYYTFFMDSIINLFYSRCPHTNKTDNQWKATFTKLNLQLKHVKYRRILFVKQVVYVLKAYEC